MRWWSTAPTARLMATPGSDSSWPNQRRSSLATTRTYGRVPFDYHAHDVELAFRTIDAVRANTAAFLRRLPDSAFGRAGHHTQSGVYTDADWFRIYAEHLEVPRGPDPQEHSGVASSSPLEVL